MNIKALAPILALGSLGSTIVVAQESKPANILFIMTDDHAQNAISAYDGRLNQTPNLDRIAAHGMRFENSFVANSISGPSRACMLTGKHSHVNGFTDNNKRFDGSQQTFPKLLQRAGYTTAVIGKWHLTSNPQGFDHWEIHPGQGSYYNPDFYTANGKTRYKGYATDLTSDMGISWIDSVKGTEKPFALLLHYKAVHRNWMSDSTHMGMYEDVTFPLPVNFFDHYADRLAAAKQEMSIDKDMDLANDLKMLHDSIPTRLKKMYAGGELARMSLAQRRAWDEHYDPIIKEFAQKYLSGELSGQKLAEWKYQRYMKDYMKCVASVDDNIGRVLDYMERSGLLENTIVVYTSDQGFYLGEHGWFDKRFMYEESMRTPLLIRMPGSVKGAPRGATASQMVQNIDYAPTFLELCGVEVPSDIQGQSILGILKGEKPRHWRDNGLYYHFYEYPGEHAVRKHEGVRTERYKLIHFYGADVDQWELYDLKSDPTEMRNLYSEKKMAKIRQDMHNKLSALKIQYKVEN